METTQDINCTETETCTCPDCVKARADFDAWCSAFEQRWRHRDCGPLCPECGDPRETNILPMVLR